MLLRFEVDGFKNLLGFSADFGPFTCIAGENGVGKSNVFDAIEFLSLLADHNLIEAAQLVRSTEAGTSGEPRQLFTAGDAHRSMNFAAEIIVPAHVTDDFGDPTEPTITLVRYEVQIGYEAPTAGSRLGRLVVEREDLRHINVGDAHHHMRFPHSARLFRDAVVSGRRSGGPFISTETDQGRINVHQDGGSRGRPRRALPLGAGTTVVSTVNTSEYPTILAVRHELQSWRRLALETSSLRAPDRYSDPSMIASNGRHLPAALYRIAMGAGPESTADDVYARVANRLSRLAGLDVRSLHVADDEVREMLHLVVEEGQRGPLPARSLSEGTLRFLALCIVLEDPQMTGLITMEEPENGIHPANLPEMVQLIQDVAVDPDEAPADDNPLRQIIVNTHSPGVVQLVDPADLLVAAERHVSASNTAIAALRLDGMRGTWRTPQAGGASKADILPYLTGPVGAQITLDLDVA